MALFQRVKKLIRRDWKVNKPYAEWEAPWTTFPATFVISKKSKQKEAVAHAKFLEDIQVFERNLAKVYYTDGSQKDNIASSALCRLNHTGGFDIAKSWNLGKGLEVADAEVYAITKALSSASQGLLKDIRSVYIFVDSQAAISRLQNCKGEKIIQQAVIACEKLTTARVHVQIQWCPSHMGISGNEMVDTLAK